MAKMTPEQEAAYALNWNLSRDDLKPDVQVEYDRLKAGGAPVTAARPSGAKSASPWLSPLLIFAGSVVLIIIGAVILSQPVQLTCNGQVMHPGDVCNVYVNGQFMGTGGETSRGYVGIVPFLFGILGVIIALVYGIKAAYQLEHTGQECPKCRGRLKQSATSCHYCGAQNLGPSRLPVC